MTDDGLVIRPYHAEDEEQIVALWQRCCLIVPWNDPRQDIAAKMWVQPELFLVGLNNSTLVATVMAGYEGHRGWLNYLAVSPDMQRQGIGRRMIAEVTVRMKALGCPKINLQIRSSNQAVVGFYESLGFTRDDVISMGKRLDDKTIRR